MHPIHLQRILRASIANRSPKEHYWAVHALLGRVRRLGALENRAFARLVWRDQWRFLSGVSRPIAGESNKRARAAARWLILAQEATPDDGVSLGYFPCGDHWSGWQPSYPETTGYIIPSLLDYARQHGNRNMHLRALAMADWEMEVQMPSGAVQGGPVCPPDRQRPAVFNTGMVLQGYAAILAADGRDERLFAAATRAARFLCADLDDSGHFRTHGPFVSAARIKTYNVLCAWGLYRFGEISGERPFKEAALRAVQAALAEQRDNGWFAHNDLDHPDRPLTHTIGYALQGLLEVGLASGREEPVEAVRKGIDPLIARISRHGFLAGRFHADWSPASLSACLTGSAQIAVVCLRLFETLGEERYREAGNRLLDFLKTRQPLDTPNPALNGALPGSFPLFLGDYMSAGFPNWATKYLLDGLLLQERLGRG